MEKKKKTGLIVVILILTIIVIGLITFFLFQNARVSIDEANGNEVIVMKVKKGECLEKPDNPTKEGYIFNYWMLENKEFDFTSPINENITLVANYSKIHKVTFKSDDQIIGAIEVINGETIAKSANLPSVQEKENYIFVAWQYNGTQFDLESPITSDIELDAKFEKHIVASDIKVANNTIYVELGQKVAIDYSLVPSDSTETVTFASSNNAIASVDTNGVINGLAAGTSTITLQSQSVSKKINAVVVVNPTSVSMDKEITIGISESHKLTVKVLPENASDKSVTFTSSDSSIASVDGAGTVKGLKEGSCTITVKTSNGKTTITKVNVKPVEVSSVTLDKANVKIKIGQSEKISVMVLPNNATDKTIIFSSSDASIASVDDEGTIVGKKVGTCTISAKSINGKSATCQVEVSEITVESISLDKTSLDLGRNNTYKLNVTIKPENATNKNITFETSDSSVASVASDGTIKAIKKGTTIITAKSANGKTVTCTVEVYVPVASITLLIDGSETAKTISYYAKDSEDKCATLKAQIFPSDADIQTVTWYAPDASGPTAGYSFSIDESDKNKATVTSRDVTAEYSPLSVSAYAVNKDGKKIESNVVKISRENKLQISYASNDSCTQIFESGIRSYAWDGRCVILTNIPASFAANNAAIMQQGPLSNVNGYDIELYNTHANPEGFPITITTVGGQEEKITIQVGAHSPS